MNLNVSLQDTILGLLSELRSHVLEATWVSYLHEQDKKLLLAIIVITEEKTFFNFLVC